MTHRSLNSLKQDVKCGWILTPEHTEHIVTTRGSDNRTTKLMKCRMSGELHWDGWLYHFKAAGNVTAKHSRLQGLHVAPHIGLRVQDVAVVCQLVEDLLLLVGEDDVGVEGLHHEQGLTQSARTFTQHLATQGDVSIPAKDQIKYKGGRGSNYNTQNRQTSSGSMGMMVQRAKMKG